MWHAERAGEPFTQATNGCSERREQPESPPPNPSLYAKAAWTSDPLVLSSEHRRQATKVPGGERRDGLTNPDPARLEADQPGSGQLGEVDRLREGAPSSGGRYQPEEVGHRPRTQHRGPVAADVGVVRGVAGRFDPFWPQERGHERPAPHRGR
jgi:hypothetical protein